MLTGDGFTPAIRKINLMGNTNDLNYVGSNSFSTHASASNAAVVEGNSGIINAVFAVSLSKATTVSSDSLRVCIITDDAATPVVSINNVSIAEGNSGTKLLKFTVKLSAPSSRTVTVSAKTIPATSTDITDAATAAGDYTAVPQTTITFAPGETLKNVPIKVLCDIYYEEDEEFFGLFSSPVNATLEGSSRLFTINMTKCQNFQSIRSGSMRVIVAPKPRRSKSGFREPSVPT